MRLPSRLCQRSRPGRLTPQRVVTPSTVTFPPKAEDCEEEDDEEENDEEEVAPVAEVTPDKEAPVVDFGGHQEDEEEVEGEDPEEDDTDAPKDVSQLAGLYPNAERPEDEARRRTRLSITLDSQSSGGGSSSRGGASSSHCRAKSSYVES